jgi:hypothetical protein
LWSSFVIPCRQVFGADNRAETEKFAREQIRHEGAVLCIELRESAP